MNTRQLELCLIKNGLKAEDTIVLDVYTTGSVTRVRPLDETNDLYKFNHITAADFVKIEDFENDYAKMFLWHNTNLVAFNDDNETILLYKTDGTIINYE